MSMLRYAALRKQNMTEESTLSELIRGAILFAMRSCEYLEVGGGERRTKKLRLRNIRFDLSSEDGSSYTLALISTEQTRYPSISNTRKTNPATTYHATQQQKPTTQSGSRMGDDCPTHSELPKHQPRVPSEPSVGTGWQTTPHHFPQRPHLPPKTDQGARKS